jgi:CDP-diacylglycerol--glycerol-3-phosphate 3-phosphatidyltransferase
VNFANGITLARLLVTLICFALLEAIPDPGQPDRTLAWLAMVAFIAAAASDFVDGWVARSWGQVTAFGRVADPFVDKVLVCGALVLLLRFPAVAALLPGWFVVLIVGREFLVTSIRGLIEARGIPFPAERLGKWKMVAQSVTAAALISLIAGIALWRPIAVVGLWVTGALTVLSCAQYVQRAAQLLGGGGHAGR